MVYAHPASALWHHFHQWIIKKMDLETVSHSDIPNRRKSHNCAQSGSQEAPKMHPKIDKNGHLDLKVPVGCPCGPLDHQNGHSGHQNGTSRSPKSQFWV